MHWQRMWSLTVILALAVVAMAAPETKLAGIRIGMKPAEVIKLLGLPNGIYLAQPPLVIRDPSALEGGVGGAMAGIAAGAAAATEALVEPQNTIIFINSEQGGREIELAPATTVAPASADDKAAASGATLPAWAYVMRPTTLSLEQQVMVYKINPTYTLATTITGRGAEAKVSDIVVCSFEPFKRDPNTFQPLKFSPKTINTYSPTLRRIFPASTKEGKGAMIGSSLAEVLGAHRWPEVFVPFATSKMDNIQIAHPRNKDDRGSSVPDIAVVVAPKENVASGASQSFGSTLAGNMPPAIGEFPVTFTDGKDLLYPVGFSKNCLLIYPSSSVAFTLVNFTVVRIQIGAGVVRPLKPPTPEAVQGTAGTAGM